MSQIMGIPSKWLRLQLQLQLSKQLSPKLLKREIQNQPYHPTSKNRNNSSQQHSRLSTMQISITLYLMRTTPTQDKDLITSHQSPIQWAIIEIHLIANTLQQEIRTLRALPSLITTTSSLLPLPIHTILNLTKTRLSKINTNLLNIPIVE